jgi:hypothetical protein
MLFGPEDGQQIGDPGVDRRKPMKPGVAGGTDGDQQIGVAVTGMPVMNVEVRIPCPAGPTPETVSVKDRVAVSGEIIFGMPAAPVTTASKARRWPEFARRRRKTGLSAGNGSSPEPAGGVSDRYRGV